MDDVKKIDPDWLVPKPKQDFICGVCHHLLDQPVLGCPGGHTFCRGCYVRALSVTGKCPGCRHPTRANKLMRNLPLQNLSLELEMRCEHAGNEPPAKRAKTGPAGGTREVEETREAAGCSWRGTVSDYRAQHLDSCGYSKVVCPNVGCDATVLRQDLQAHAATCHPICLAIRFPSRVTEHIHTTRASPLQAGLERLCNRVGCKLDDLEVRRSDGRLIEVDQTPAVLGLQPSELLHAARKDLAKYPRFDVLSRRGTNSLLLPPAVPAAAITFQILGPDATTSSDPHPAASFFAVLPDAAMSASFEVFLARAGFEADEVRFSLKGRRLFGHQTAEKIGLGSRAVIHASLCAP